MGPPAGGRPRPAPRLRGATRRGSRLISGAAADQRAALRSDGLRARPRHYARRQAVQSAGDRRGVPAGAGRGGGARTHVNPQGNTPRTAPATAAAKQSFAALRHAGFRAQFITYVLAMMADNIEHVISYWMVFQKFQSPALAGFAVVSHWLPFLLFSVATGALADRFDPRRLIQCGMGLFIIASLGWGYFFITDTLQMWHAMVLLVIHGCGGVLWQTPNQMLLYDIVGPAELSSGVRLNATARYLGVLVGPAVGGVIMLALGPSLGILVNTVYYLPLVVWLVNAPYGPRFRKGIAPLRRAVRGLADIVQTMRDIAGHHVIVSMTLLGGCGSFFVGNAYNAQMPGFALDPGHGDPGVAYSSLLAADAAGAMLAGVLLASRALLAADPRTALHLR